MLIMAISVHLLPLCLFVSGQFLDDLVQMSCPSDIPNKCLPSGVCCRHDEYCHSGICESCLPHKVKEHEQLNWCRHHGIHNISLMRDPSCRFACQAKFSLHELNGNSKTKTKEDTHNNCSCSPGEVKPTVSGQFLDDLVQMSCPSDIPNKCLPSGVCCRHDEYCHSGICESCLPHKVKEHEQLNWCRHHGIHNISLMRDPSCRFACQAKFSLHELNGNSKTKTKEDTHNNCSCSPGEVKPTVSGQFLDDLVQMSCPSDKPNKCLPYGVCCGHDQYCHSGMCESCLPHKVKEHEQLNWCRHHGIHNISLMRDPSCRFACQAKFSLHELIGNSKTKTKEDTHNNCSCSPCEVKPTDGNSKTKTKEDTHNNCSCSPGEDKPTELSSKKQRKRNMDAIVGEDEGDIYIYLLRLIKPPEVLSRQEDQANECKALATLNHKTVTHL